MKLLLILLLVYKLNMFRSLFTCFKSTHVEHSTTGFSTKYDNTIEDICIRITNKPKPITLLDTKSMFDSTGLLNTNTNIDWKDTTQFIPPVEKGIVIKVYDGDTITIASKLPYPESPLYRFSVRLNGIDCPEIKCNNDDEKACALIAKNTVSELVLHKVVTLKNIQTEKYGRILADVYIDNLHVNQHLIEKRLAVTYDGKTKNSPKNWMNYYSTGEL